MNTLQKTPDHLPVEQAAAQLIASRRSPNTRDAYARDWARWRAFAQGISVDLVSPTLLATTGFREALSKDLSSASVARVLASLSFFYKAFLSAGIVSVNPFARAWLPRPPQGSRNATKAIDSYVVQMILDQVRGEASTGLISKNLRDHALLQLLYDTGIRRSSVQLLERAKVDAKGARITVKGGREEVVTFTAECARALGAWLRVAPPSRFVFPSRDPEKPIHLSTVNEVLEYWAKIAGVVGRVHPHMFRAAFITDGYSAQVYERELQAAAHHKDASTTRRYDRGARGQTVVDEVAKFRKGVKP